MKPILPRLSFVLAAVAFLHAPVSASSDPVPAPATTLAGGLRAPSKTLLSRMGTLFVAEAGNGPNTGRISMVHPKTGARRTLIDGLPSGFAAPSNQPSGPSGLLMIGRTLYFTVSTGDAVVNGAAPGSTVPNTAVSSPLFTSVLAIHLGPTVERATRGFTLSRADHDVLKSGSAVVLRNDPADRVVIELVADFPDHVPEPRPDQPDNVRASNPFGMAVICDRMFVVDASFNRVHTVDLDSGEVGTLTTFAPVPNTRGFGPPVVEAVPDSIRLHGDQLLVTYLTGFPFPLGGAQVRLVDPETGANGPAITGLTSAISVMPLDSGGYLTLEFSTDMLLSPAPPGRLQWFETPSATPVLINGTLITPTSLEVDERNGVIYITEIFAGRIVKIALPRQKCRK